MAVRNPIGIFDSGVGGLSVARRIRELLPNEDLIYIADSAHAPYGDKSEHYIGNRSSEIIQFLQTHNIKAVVIACNTATTSAIKSLRAEYTLPIIGVEPGLKPAAVRTRSGVIGVLATAQTLRTESFNDLAKGFSVDAQIEVQPCPGLVEQVETLELDSDKTRKLITKYVSPLLERGADNIVLGCTHYAFLEPLIRQVAGPEIEIINTAFAVAKETVRRLEAEDLLSTSYEPGQTQFWSTGVNELTAQLFSELWGDSVNVLQMA